MAVVRLQSETEKRKGVYYEFDTEDEPLGAGGMGKVYRGRCVNEQTRMVRDVAIKFIFDGVPEHVIERARRESAIQIRNDNLVEMLGFIEINEKVILGEIKKRYHVVSELLVGVVLEDLLQGKTTDQNNRPIPFAEKLYSDYKKDPYRFAMDVIRNVLSGIMALHDAGYVHRDIDPTNIMVTADGHIKLIDFGIAKQLNRLNTQDKSLTNAGVFIGKPWYAAPELVLGDVKHQNQTTDIYAIGILYFQLCTGIRPFDGPHHEVLNMQLKKTVPLKMISDKKTRAMIAKATAKKQKARYQNAAEFRVALNKETKQSFALLGTIVGGVAATVLTAFLFWNLTKDPKPDEERQPLRNSTYQEAVHLLKSANTRTAGIEMLKELAHKNDYNATYLLSRLFFDAQYKKKYDQVPDSIWQLQMAAQIKPDYKEVPQLLQKAVKINPNDCNSLYDLGLEYFVGNRESLEERNVTKAREYLNKALEVAQKNKNEQVIRAVKKLKEDYPKELGK